MSRWILGKPRYRKILVIDLKNPSLVRQRMSWWAKYKLMTFVPGSKSMVIDEMFAGVNLEKIINALKSYVIAENAAPRSK